ncbi:MAG: hypothetical protein CHACPFDD_02119 [Phycisphaerae bacterium]|nr:hypothetical protein [Phycisphaerae bacterium]
MSILPSFAARRVARAPLAAAVVSIALSLPAWAQRVETADWIPLFNGKDLTGWKGLVSPDGGPPARARMKPDELAKAQQAADEKMRSHWSVKDGVLVFDGKGDSICTERDYGDFELKVDWKLEADGDSGIYLRGSPQVQIWDASKHPEGSGGLYNNQKNPAKPSTRADRPVGEWNSFRIRMVGERVTVYLNDTLVVDNVVLENYWERDKPIYASGQIELQNHGNTLYFRNIAIREIPRTSAAPADGANRAATVGAAPRVLALPPQQSGAANAALVPADRKDEWWVKRNAAMNERIKLGKVDLVFIGDSITQGWEGEGKAAWEKHFAPLNAVNLGISGDRTQHVLWRLDHGHLDGLVANPPKAAVIMIGTNNSNGADHTAAEIAEGVTTIVGRIREKLPKTRILLLGIFPRGEKPNPQREKNAEASKLAAKVADGKMVQYLDIGEKFLQPDGTLSKEIMPDFLHLSPKGYDIWAEAVLPKVKELLGR